MCSYVETRNRAELYTSPQPGVSQNIKWEH